MATVGSDAAACRLRNVQRKASSLAHTVLCDDKLPNSLQRVAKEKHLNGDGPEARLIAMDDV